MTLQPLRETREDIASELQRIMRDQLPGANTEEGYPIYDLVVKPFVEIIYSERETVEVLRQISSVLPLFDENGALKYTEYKETLLARYFITEEYQTPEDSFLTLLFPRKTNLFIAPLSYVTLGATQVYLFPAIVSVESVGWYSSGNKFAYDIPIQFSNTTIPQSSAWDTTNLDLRTSDETELYGTLTKDYATIAGSTGEPTLTLSTIQDSISNRSYSNRRALRYHLATDLVFNPADLRKFEILGSNDRIFIEGYEQIYKTSPTTGETIPIQVRTGGRGKVIMDYGYSDQSTRSTLLPVSENEPSPYDLPRHANRILYKIPIKQSIGLMHPTALYFEKEDTIDPTTVIKTKLEALETTADYSYTRVYDSAEKRSYCTKDPELLFNGYPANTLYKSGVYVEWTAAVPDIIDFIAIYGIGDNVDRNHTTVFYPTFKFADDNKSVVIQLYADHADGSPPVIVSTGFHAVLDVNDMNNKEIVLEEVSGSGISAVVKLATITSLAPSSAQRTIYNTMSVDRRFVRGSTVLGVSNDHIYVELSFNRGMTATSIRRDIDGHAVNVLYSGTDANELALSQAAFYDIRKREVPSDISVAPYRAIVFTMNLDKDYVAPLREGPRTTAEISNYNILADLLKEYLDTFTGTFEEFNINDVYMKFSQQAGGLTINRLDYYMYTQYGLEITKGYLSVFDPNKYVITQSDVLAGISSTVGGAYPEVIAEEQAVFSPNMYKLIFSPVFRTH